MAARLAAHRGIVAPRVARAQPTIPVRCARRRPATPRTRPAGPMRHVRRDPRSGRRRAWRRRSRESTPDRRAAVRLSWGVWDAHSRARSSSHHRTSAQARGRAHACSSGTPGTASKTSHASSSSRRPASQRSRVGRLTASRAASIGGVPGVACRIQTLRRNRSSKPGRHAAGRPGTVPAITSNGPSRATVPCGAATATAGPSERLAFVETPLDDARAGGQVVQARIAVAPPRRREQRSQQRGRRHPVEEGDPRPSGDLGEVAAVGRPHEQPQECADGPDGCIQRGSCDDLRHARRRCRWNRRG